MTVTIITGGTRGIGAAIARRLSAAGHSLVLGYASDEASASILVAELGPQVIAVRADVTSDEGIESLFRAAIEQFGRVDALVNNAGATLNIGPLVETPVEIIRRVLDLNLTAAILCARRAVQQFDAQGSGGVIVNISSAAATLGSGGDYVHYAAAKAGVDALTLGLGRETAARGIRVIGVAPGLIETRIHADAGHPERLEAGVARVPMGRVGQPDDIAPLVAWLFSDEAAYLTATTIRVAGGL